MQRYGNPASSSAINAANSLKAVRTLDAVLCGEHELAAAMLDEQLTVARRMHVVVVERYLLMVDQGTIVSLRVEPNILTYSCTKPSDAVASTLV